MPQTANNVPVQAYWGVSISWGLGPTAMTIPNAGMLVQTNDDELTYDKAEIRDQRGGVVAVAYYNPHDMATIEYIATTTGSYDSGTASIGYPTQGQMITIGSESTDPVSGSNWLVDSVMVRKANTDAAKVQLKVTRYGQVLR